MNPSEKVQNQVELTEDRCGAPANVATASKSITSFRGLSGSESLPYAVGIRHHVRNNKDSYGIATAEVDSGIAMSSVWLALWRFDQQMEAQRKSTVALLVNESFNQVGELKTIGKTGTDEQATGIAIHFFISFAQMLLDAEDTAPNADDIGRIAGAKIDGSYVGKRLGVIG